MANKIFYTILALLIIGSVGATFYKIVVQKNYQIVAETSCDPTSTEEAGTCYIYECDPIEEDDCPLNEAERISYYKIINKSASTIYACEQGEDKEGCDEELTCTEGEENCSYSYCDPENLEEWEVCAE